MQPCRCISNESSDLTYQSMIQMPEPERWIDMQFAMPAGSLPKRKSSITGWAICAPCCSTKISIPTPRQCRNIASFIRKSLSWTPAVVKMWFAGQLISRPNLKSRKVMFDPYGLRYCFRQVQSCWTPRAIKRDHSVHKTNEVLSP